MRGSRKSYSRLAIFGFALLIPAPAAAQYLDPGSASVIVQAIVAGVVAVGAGIKLYWSRLSGLFSRRRSEDQESSER